MVLNEEQSMLARSAAEFVDQHCPVSALRALRDAPEQISYCPDTWQAMVQLGWAGMLLPEAYGGADFGYQGLACVLEQQGRVLAASPLFATAALAAPLILAGGSEFLRQQLLPAVAAGECTLALALDEGPHFDPLATALEAEPDGDGFVLTGTKHFVVDGASANGYVVVARSASKPGDDKGLSLFWVSADAPGLTVQRHELMDARDVASIQFERVRLEAAALLGARDEGLKLLAPVLDRAAILLAAEMLGGAQACFDSTLAYLQQREQFGVKIGSFQALKHRAAKWFVDLDLARSTVLAAAEAAQRGGEDLGRLASLAKCRLNELYIAATSEAVQMHGGVGVTDELDIGLYLKRARVCAQLLGDAEYHRDRFARLSGF